MKAIHRVLLAVVTLASGHVQAQVNALPPTRHILVYGDAQARAIPDRFRIAIEFEATDLNPDVARQAVEAHVADTLAKLQAQKGNQQIDVAIMDDGPMYQAIQLGFMPRMQIKHTSASTAGQIYIPTVN